MAEESNKELEDWVNIFCDLDSFCDEETKTFGRVWSDVRNNI